MAFIANQNPYRSKSAPAKPTDFIRLSFDKVEERKQRTPEEIVAKFGKFKDPDK